MHATKLSIVFLILVGLLVGTAFASSEGRIYGRILTVDGDELEGLIRWDKNEGNWVDVLDGTKELSDKHDRDKDSSRRKKYRSHQHLIEIFGIKFGKSSNVIWESFSAQSGIRFGHIRRLEVLDDDRALIELKSGEEVEFCGGSTDIGTSIREIIIEDVNEGELELTWEDIEVVEFMATPSGIESNFGNRLYGTLTTRRGDEFKGFVCWDVDELFTTDILDGDEKRRSRKIKFGKIKSIERYSSSGATIILTNGNDMILRGSNDVDDDNRGITISDPGFGQVTVDWDEFSLLEFSEAPNEIGYDAFDGGRSLAGTVYTEDGDSYSGQIRWDDDEEYTWEVLDGDYHKMEFDIEFGLIKRIDKKSSRSSLVTTRDGHEFRLRGSNDVNSDNKGIYVLSDDGDEVEIDWDEFDYIEFNN